MANRLVNKVCVITGAASGQGRSAAEIFSREDASLVLSDVDVQGLQEIGEVVRRTGADPVLHHGDLTTETANQELIDLTQARYGRVDTIYNAAGLVRFSAIHETSLEDWNFVIAHELTMTFLACRHAIRAMLLGGGGSIINMSSLSGLYSNTRRHGAHAATKAAVVGLTKQIAVEYGPSGIRCNAIAPSKLVYSPGQKRVEMQNPALAADDVPLRRHATPEDTALCAVYLASDESRFVTGQVFVVDGGRSAA